MPSIGSGSASTCAVPAATKNRINAAASRTAPVERIKYRIHFMISFLKDEVHYFHGAFEPAISAYHSMRLARVSVELHHNAGIEGVLLIFSETILFTFFAAGININT